LDQEIPLTDHNLDSRKERYQKNAELTRLNDKNESLRFGRVHEKKELNLGRRHPFLNGMKRDEYFYYDGDINHGVWVMNFGMKKKKENRFLFLIDEDVRREGNQDDKKGRYKKNRGKK
jgi:hypothetical protein